MTKESQYKSKQKGSQTATLSLHTSYNNTYRVVGNPNTGTSYPRYH